MMFKAILFDLDDTLLGNEMDHFLPGYFELLGQFAERYLPRDQFLQELMICTEAMIRNVDPALSNREVFWQRFEQRTGLDSAKMEPFFEQFYRHQFHQLQGRTEKRPFAPQLVQFCLDHNLDVVVATNPLFPRIAIEARLDWAGLPVDAYNFALVTAYENMHAAKPQPAYYAEILDKIGCQPAQALMVGNDWENDILPARSLGIHTYWLSLDGTPPPDEVQVAYGRTLQDVYTFLAAQLAFE
ncbi:HAD family hydrolase [Candidatus Leptofilum sp.]|uniref:HAD family hydrolase n=1 Tax=Candidatus Leptofilum sp. TaxID=3241576 RepID=UPI003B5B7DBC